MEAPRNCTQSEHFSDIPFHMQAKKYCKNELSVKIILEKYYKNVR